MHTIFLNRQVKWEGLLPVPDTSPRRKWWYLDEERDKTRWSISNINGMWVKVSRVIVRTGYYFEPTDIEPSNWPEMYDLIMIEQLKKCFPDLQLEHQQWLSAVHKLPEEFGRKVGQNAAYQMRGMWMRKLYELPHFRAYHRKRAFWYVNIPDVNQDFQQGKLDHVWLEVVRNRRHLVGTQYPATGGGMWDDYEPAGLSVSQSQMVHWCQGVFARTYEDYADHMVEVHPCDVLDVKPKNEVPDFSKWKGRRYE